MGFWEKLGESAGNAIREGNQSYETTRERAGGMSDRQLYNGFRNESGSSINSMAKKMAYAQELKDRGYGNTKE